MFSNERATMPFDATNKSTNESTTLMNFMLFFSFFFFWFHDDCERFAMISFLPRNGSFCSMILYANDTNKQFLLHVPMESFWSSILGIVHSGDEQQGRGIPGENVIYVIYAGDISSSADVAESPLARLRGGWKTSRFRRRRSGCLRNKRVVHNSTYDLLFQMPIRAKGDERSTSSRENTRRDFSLDWVIMRACRCRSHLLCPAADNIAESSRIPISSPIKPCINYITLNSGSRNRGLRFRNESATGVLQLLATIKIRNSNYLGQ